MQLRDSGVADRAGTRGEMQMRRSHSRVQLQRSLEFRYRQCPLALCHQRKGKIEVSLRVFRVPLEKRALDRDRLVLLAELLERKAARKQGLIRRRL